MPAELRGTLTVLNPSEVLVVEEYLGEQRVRHAVLRCGLVGGRCEAAWRSAVERDFGAVAAIRPAPIPDA